jgi:predicted CoA-substrate-specific enzyme activase
MMSSCQPTKHDRAEPDQGDPVWRIGLDVGSTTVKLVTLQDDVQIASEYLRHHADVHRTVTDLVGNLAEQFTDAQAQFAVTGSGGLGLATRLDLRFVQEVVAGTEAIRRLLPDVDVAIELGGEDAKITYLGAAPEQRMNGTCAGGTGAFIDQMASLLRTDAAGLDKLAARYRNLYPIASRCGVFAKSDLQPLINDGARREDLAASIFQAVALQTIAGLACGHPIRGRVALLGGPLHYLPQLRAAFARVLEPAGCTLVVPDQAQLFVATGAALLAGGPALGIAALDAQLRDGGAPGQRVSRMRPLFQDDDERQAFTERHTRRVPRGRLADAVGPCFLGIDAGSTTIKAVLTDSEDRILHSSYGDHQGDPVAAAVRTVRKLRRNLPPTVTIGRSCATGYGEGLVTAALGVDEGVVETMAHYRAARHLAPDVTSVIDIGGQDMKYLRIRDGAVDDITVNEACSAGCGSFLQTSAAALGIDLEPFCALALRSGAPVDLGSRCTVFMNSSVKQAQKDGADVGDIAAGLSYAVVRNALHKVIRLVNPEQLGPVVVVQGGTFLNDAVLRAFELLTGREVVRPDIAGLMGAYGAALMARSAFAEHGPGRLRTDTELEQLAMETELKVCGLCQNQCRRTISTFTGGTRYISGNRCDRGGDAQKPKQALPNLVEYKYRRLFGYRRLTAAQAVRGDLGIPRALNLYENYPFWFTVLSALKYRVILSSRSDRDTLAKGMESIVSENICYPAKLVHGHVVNLIERGVRTIFYPAVPYEQELVQGSDNHYNCPVVASYPEVIAGNVEQLRENGVRLLSPFLNLADEAKLAERVAEIFAADGVTEAEARAAVRAGYEEDAVYKADIREAGRRALAFLTETGTHGVVLAGRPYHVDPELNHGIPELVNSLGLAVLTEDSILPENPERPALPVRDQWAYHSRLFAAAAVVTQRDDLYLVQLNSFGCGLDAVTAEQATDLLRSHDRLGAVLKIDEVSNLGTARIRLRSLLAASTERQALGCGAGADDGRPRRVPERRSLVPVVPPSFTKQMRRTRTLITAQLAPTHFALMEGALARTGLQVEVLPTVTDTDIDVGLQYVNNDACYPAVIIVGQLINAFLTGRHDPGTTAILTTQTGGMCRATNYTTLLRRGLAQAGFGEVPVAAISPSGLERHPGFPITPGLVRGSLKAVVLGDLLQSLLLRVRPYELEPGAATTLMKHWLSVAREVLRTGRSTALGRRLRYAQLVEEIVGAFASLPLEHGPRRPRVGVVGEILVKYHPDANDHVIDLIEAEGCEVVLPGLTEWVLNSMYTADWNYRTLGTEPRARHVKKVLRTLVALHQAPVRRAVARAGGRFTPPPRLPEMIERLDGVVSLGNQAGEGWLLTAEIMELLAHGVSNVLCVQPFGCLPNHVTGKGMFRPIRERYPHANVTAVDYDPGVSKVNQLNRIKLLLAIAHAAAARPAVNP